MEMATLVGGWEVNLTALQYNFDLYSFYCDLGNHGILVRSFRNNTRFYISVGPTEND